MKLIVVACALVAIAVAAPAKEQVKLTVAVDAKNVAVQEKIAKKIVSVIRSSFNQKPEGNYFLSFETDDGVKREETGEIKEALNEEKKPQKVVVVSGSYSYVDPNGELQEITYTADETGFHAEGKSIPKLSEDNATTQ